MNATGAVAADARSLDELRHAAHRDPKAATRQAAVQFEAMFMQMVLKSMREAMPKSGMFDGAGKELYEGMLDGQLAQSLSGRPGGLAEMIARQLSQHMRGGDTPAVGAAGAPATPAAGEPARDERVTRAAATMAALDAAGEGEAERADARPGNFGPLAGAPLPPSVAYSGSAAARAAGAIASSFAAGRPLVPLDTRTAGGIAGPAAALAARRAEAAAPRTRAEAAEGTAPSRAKPAALHGAQSVSGTFLRRMWEPATAAQQATGVPAAFIVGQAALESGWGRHEIKHPDGRSAHNLFGIKATGGWSGDVVESVTTEYVDGRPVRSVERFRAYGSYAEAFADWARLMKNNPRYAPVLQAGGSVEQFARGLQDAGYATDPEYANKLSRTIRQALAVGQQVI